MRPTRKQLREAGITQVSFARCDVCAPCEPGKRVLLRQARTGRTFRLCKECLKVALETIE